MSSKRPRTAAERRHKERCDKGVVYFVRGYDMVKIGWTMNVKGRLRDLQTGSPVPLVVLCSEPGGPERESQLHARFARYRSHGEWFRLRGDVLDYVTSHIAPRRRSPLLQPIAKGVDRRGPFLQEHLAAKQRATEEQVREIDAALERASAQAEKGPLQ